MRRHTSTPEMSGNIEIEDDEIRSELGHFVQRATAGFGAGHLVALLAKVVGEHVADVGLVLDDEDAPLSGADR